MDGMVMTDEYEYTRNLDLLGDWLDAKGYGEEAGLCTRVMDHMHKQDARIAELEAALIAVYRHMDMDGTEIDCCDLQGTLIKHGILVAYTATEPCGDCCTCAEYGPEFPMTCYRLNDDLRAARAALEKKND
jgi:hypothetical protein